GRAAVQQTKNQRLAHIPTNEFDGDLSPEVRGGERNQGSCRNGLVARFETNPRLLLDPCDQTSDLDSPRADVDQRWCGRGHVVRFSHAASACQVESAKGRRGSQAPLSA